MSRIRVRTGCPLLRRGGQGARAGPWTRQRAPRDARRGGAGSSLGTAKLERRGRVGLGGEVRGGGDRTHRGRRRGCPRARGPRVAWRRRVAGKVPGSGGRPAPPRAGPPWCALGPGAPPPHIGARETADPAPAVPCRARPGCPAAPAAPCPLSPARPGPSPRRLRPSPGCGQRAHAQPAASDCGTLPFRGRPPRSGPPHPLPPAPSLPPRGGGGGGICRLIYHQSFAQAGIFKAVPATFRAREHR